MIVVWVLICLVIIPLNFLPNKLINTDSRSIYIGSLIIILGALLGMRGATVLAVVLLAIGMGVVLYGSELAARAIKAKELVKLRKYRRKR